MTGVGVVTGGAAVVEMLVASVGRMVLCVGVAEMVVAPEVVVKFRVGE